MFETVSDVEREARRREWEAAERVRREVVKVLDHQVRHLGAVIDEYMGDEDAHRAANWHLAQIMALSEKLRKAQI